MDVNVFAAKNRGESAIGGHNTSCGKIGKWEMLADVKVYDFDFDVKATDSAGQIDFRHVIVDANVRYPDQHPLGVPETIRSQPFTWSNEPWTVAVNSTDNPLWVGTEPSSGLHPGLTEWHGELTIVTEPTHGTLVADLDNGYVLYTPNAGFQGLDSFTYNWTYDTKNEAGDPLLGSSTTNTATFSIQVGNWIDLLPATTYDNDVHKSILGVGQSETTTLVLQNPRGDGVPVTGYWTLNFDRSQIRVYDSNGKEILADRHQSHRQHVSRDHPRLYRAVDHANGRRRIRRPRRPHRHLDSLGRPGSLLSPRGMVLEYDAGNRNYGGGR